jgi:hypothetical protein
MELYCTPKSQHTTVKHSLQLFEHTYRSNLYGLGTLTPIEFFQQDLLWQSSNTNSHSCSQKVSKHTSGQSIIGLSVHLRTATAPWRINPSLTPTIDCLHHPRYKLACFSRNFPIRTQSSNQKESVAKHTHVCTRRFPNTTDYISGSP